VPVGKRQTRGAKVPYRLPELVAAPPSVTVYIFEGEGCADAAARLGFVSTTNSEGADTGNGKKWTSELNKWFRDRNVIIVADNDLPGRKHVQHVAKNLHGVAKTVRVLDLAPHWPGEAMPVGHDVVEWFEQHDRAGSRLALLAKDEPLWEARADDGKGTREDVGGGADKDTDDGRSARPKQADLLIDLAHGGRCSFTMSRAPLTPKSTLRGTARHGPSGPQDSGAGYYGRIIRSTAARQTPRR
jgi:hypothetical protein